MGKGSSAATVGYKYFAGLHWTFCHGPIDKLIQIRVDKKQAWIGGQADGSISINLPDLFGGDAREGGVSGTLDILSGSPTQSKNPYLVSVIGNLVSAHRGFGGLIARQFYVGNNPYLKQWDFIIQRIFLADNGLDQWYKEKAGILSPLVLESGAIVAPDDGIHSSGLNIGNGNYFNTANPATYTPYPNQPITLQAAIEITRNAATTPGSEFAFLNYHNFRLERHYDTASVNITCDGDDGSRTLGVWQWDGVQRNTTTVPLYDMNPAHIIRECLTNATWGMGYPDSDMGDSFTVCADTLFDEFFGLSLEWKDDSAIEDFVKDVMRYIDAVIQVDRTTGKFELKLIRNDYDISTLLHLTPSNIDKVANYTYQKFGELQTTATVEYWDNANLTTKTITITDGALAAAQDNDIAVTNKYPGITNDYLAARIAARDLKVASTPIRSCQIYATTIAKNLKLGDVFLWTWPEYDIVNLPMRITAISYGDGKTNRVLISCTEDIFGANSDTLTTTTPSIGWVDPKSPPGAATDAIAFEVPYLEAVQRQGQAAVDALDPTAGYVGMAASGAPRAVNARLWTDSGAGYADAGSLDFCPACRLNADIGKLDTTISVKNENNFDQLTPQTWFQVDDELLNFISYDPVAHTITVARGLLDTVPAGHSANALCMFWDYDNGVDTTEYASGESIKLKLLTANGSGTLPLTSATENTIDVAGRLALPYPPGNLKINGAYFPANSPSALNLTWSHRDRKQQTSSNYVGFTDSDIGPETGVTYGIKIYDQASNNLLFSKDGIADNFYKKSSIANAITNSQIRIEVDSIRDTTLRSFQKQTAVLLYAGGGSAALTPWQISFSLPSNVSYLYSALYDATSNLIIGLIGSFNNPASAGPAVGLITFNPTNGQIVSQYYFGGSYSPDRAQCLEILNGYCYVTLVPSSVQDVARVLKIDMTLPDSQKIVAYSYASVNYAGGGRLGNAAISGTSLFVLSNTGIIEYALTDLSVLNNVAIGNASVLILNDSARNQLVVSSGNYGIDLYDTSVRPVVFKQTLITNLPAISSTNNDQAQAMRILDDKLFIVGVKKLYCYSLITGNLISSFDGTGNSGYQNYFAAIAKYKSTIVVASPAKNIVEFYDNTGSLTDFFSDDDATISGFIEDNTPNSSIIPGVVIADSSGTQGANLISKWVNINQTALQIQTGDSLTTETNDLLFI